MIGVVIPAHNEQETIAATLSSVLSACAHPALKAEIVQVVVVLDACTDRTEELTRTFPVQVLQANERNVGRVRRLGAAEAIAAGARWLAFTDADTEVAPDWLVQQLALEADAVCGTVGANWGVLGELEQFMRAHWARTYNDADNHRHVHGANLGVSTMAYQAAGGFLPLECSEDVSLVEALVRTGAHVVWSAAPRVTTSARLDARARGGFGDTLAAVLAAATQPQSPNERLTS